jgi:hypothetical protein
MADEHRLDTGWACRQPSLGGLLPAALAWLDRIDPGTHRRIKGLRLITAYGIAAMLSTMPDIVRGLPDGAALSSLAGGFALWVSLPKIWSGLVPMRRWATLRPGCSIS